jgi:hypothetical protein
LSVVVGPGGPTLPGQGAPFVETGPVLDKGLRPEIGSAPPGALVVTLLGRTGTGKERLLEQDKIAYQSVAGAVSVLAPDGPVARQGRLDDPALQLRLVP